MNKILGMLLLVLAASAIQGLIAGTVKAAAPAVKIAPLKYQESIPLDKPKTGFVDVSNPATEKIILTPEIQAFRQIGTQGELEFYNDEAVQAGITINIQEFELGPREAARITFSIDPKKLRPGGVYAAIFFKTRPALTAAAGNQVMASARAGSLLILDIGAGGTKSGRISKVNVNRFNFGNSLRGAFEYTNTANGALPIAFNPKFTVKYGLLGGKTSAAGPLVLPKSTRSISFTKNGSYFGIVPITVEDATGSSKPVTAYALAITGFWRWVVMLLVAAVFVTMLLNRRAKK